MPFLPPEMANCGFRHSHVIFDPAPEAGFGTVMWIPQSSIEFAAGSGTVMLFSTSPSQFWHSYVILDLPQPTLQTDPQHGPALGYLPTSGSERS